jgi:hypothetical protein
MHAFTIITAVFALTALLAAAMAYRLTHRAATRAGGPAKPDALTGDVHATAAKSA